MYNLTNVTNANNIFETVSAVNSLAGGWLIGTLLVVVFFITLIAMQGNFKVKLLASSFITSIIAVLSFAAKWININLVVIPVLVLFASILIYKFTE